MFFRKKRLSEDFLEDLLEDVRICQLKAGDTVLDEGEAKTVGKADFGHDGLLGPTFRGDSYRAGHDKITRITYAAERHRQNAKRLRRIADPEPDEGFSP